MDKRVPDRARGTRLPLHAPRLRIGLLGGSFNPPHAAHRAASLFALRHLGLDRVWWLVTPGNPLKETGNLPALEQRLAAAHALANHPRIDVTDIEARFGTRYSVDTLRILKRRYPLVRFVWLMGADNLVKFHRWRSWRAIAALVPIAVIDRGLVSLGAHGARAPRALARYRLPEHAARTLPGRRPPAWVIVHGLKLPLSSTALRGLQDKSW
jgi:nicotinate-nucleotide adenylyltransferase